MRIADTRISTRPRIYDSVAVYSKFRPNHDEERNSFIDYKAAHEVKVKWYNAKDGYGFVRLNNYSKDIFLHAIVLKRAGITTVSTDDILQVYIGVGKQEGKKMVTKVLVAADLLI